MSLSACEGHPFSPRPASSARGHGHLPQARTRTRAPSRLVPRTLTLGEGLQGQGGLARLQRQEALALQGQDMLLLELLHLEELLLEGQLLGGHLLLQDTRRET